MAKAGWGCLGLWRLVESNGCILSKVQVCLVVPWWSAYRDIIKMERTIMCVMCGKWLVKYL